MVGRLVKEQQIGIPEESPGESRSHHPSAAELAHRPQKVVLFETQTRQDRFRLVLAVVTASRLQLLVELANAVQQSTLFVRVGLR